MSESYSDDASSGAERARTESLRAAQHALNDALTALLAEAQLLELELEPLPDEHRRAAGRIVELARRAAKVARQLGGPGS
jgi:signal transduction histidine kinase